MEKILNSLATARGRVGPRKFWNCVKVMARGAGDAPVGFSTVAPRLGPSSLNVYDTDRSDMEIHHEDLDGDQVTSSVLAKLLENTFWSSSIGQHLQETPPLVLLTSSYPSDNLSLYYCVVH